VTFCRVAAAGLMLAACGQTAEFVPGEGASPTRCSQVIEGCTARRLDNVVLRGGAEDGALGSIDGLDTTNLIGFDEALAAARMNDFRGGARTVRVVLGAANATEFRWGTGGVRLFYAVEWGGVELPVFGPPGGDRSPEFGTWSTVLDAATGRFIVSGSG
jgi:hypothetical protein